MRSLRKAIFPNITPIQISDVLDYKIQDPNWLAGFNEAEGCFYVQILKSTTKIGYQILLRFSISQHSRDAVLMQSLIELLDCGNYSQLSNYNRVDFNIRKFSDLTDKVLPFFKKYPLQGVKLLGYLDFVKVVELMNNKAHLTKEGLDQIRKAIKASMNKGRKLDQ